MLNPNVPAWFEIPATDLDRAQRFYEAILTQPLKRERFGGAEMVVFPGGAKPNASGALIKLDDCEPTVHGSIVYLSVGDLKPVLDRAERHGGDTLVERTALPEGMGFFAQFRDCEGNRVGLWSPA
jgi:predicted enzyme related to lactoylglutathione lyase